MKILITTDLYTTKTNGVVTSIRNLMEVLRRKGHDVRVLTVSDTMFSRSENGVYYIRSVSLEKIYPNIRMPFSYRHPLIRELIDWKPDIIHRQCEFFSFQFALHVAKETGAPIVNTYHKLYEQYASYILLGKRFGRKVAETISRMRLEKVDGVIAPTRKVEEALHSYGIHNNIRIIPSGISLQQHKQRLSPEDRRQKRRALGISDDQTVLLNLGRLGTEKNLDELLRLFYAASEVYPGLVFLIVGDGPAKAELQRISMELGVHDRVFFTGMVAPSAVQEYYQLGDVFVSASTSETQGLTYIEAAANGLPLLCRSDPCLEDVLVPGENGYVYTDESGFMKALGAILGNPQWQKTARIRSEEIADSFSKDAFANAVEAMYESVLHS